MLKNGEKEKAWRTDRRTDRRINRRTDTVTYRVARTRLKMGEFKRLMTLEILNGSIVKNRTVLISSRTRAFGKRKKSNSIRRSQWNPEWGISQFPTVNKKKINTRLFFFYPFFLFPFFPHVSFFFFLSLFPSFFCLQHGEIFLVIVCFFTPFFGPSALITFVTWKKTWRAIGHERWCENRSQKAKKVNARQTNRPTDRRSDEVTYRVACTRLKTHGGVMRTWMWKRTGKCHVMTS